MTFSKLSLLTASCALATAGGVHAAIIAEAGGGTTGTAQVIDADQDGAGAFSHTITGGVGGDAVLVQSGLITTEDAPGGVYTDPSGQRLSLSGSVNGSYVVTTHDGGGGGTVDMAIDQYTDATFTTLTAGAPPRDADRGRAAFEETDYDTPGSFDVSGDLFLEFIEVGGADHTPSITFGYDVLDITNATHRTDFFRLDNLAAGDVTVSVLSDEATYGFFDSRVTFYDSAGVLISTSDGDAGLGGHEIATLAGHDGSTLFVEVNNSKSADGIVGTYELSITGTAVPEPGSLALLGLGGLLVARRRRA